MSIMGMREWFRKNRVLMLVVFVLLLVGLLISYGHFGSGSATYTAADYEKMVADAREAYEADSSNPANVQALASILADYAAFLNEDDKTDQETVKAVDDEALKYYNEYYGLMVLDATEAYQAEQNYGNAYMVASYLQQRAQVQSMIDGLDGQALAEQANQWLVTAMTHRVDEVNADLAENPTDHKIIADLADATVALAYYQHELDADTDLDAAYWEGIDILKQAIENCGDDVEPDVLAGYYQKAAGYAANAGNNVLAEEYYRTSLETAPNDYDANVALASFLLGEARYDETIELLSAYRETLSDDDANAASIDSSIEYVKALKEAAENPDTNADTDTDADGDADVDNNSGDAN